MNSSGVNRTRFLIFVSGLLAVLLCGPSCRRLPGMATVKFGTDSGGTWTELFDGKSLTGWRASEHPESWNVRNGMLVAHGDRAHLFYVGTGDQPPHFTDFELEAEVKTEPNSNSGIYFHTAYQDTGWPGRGIESQVNNSFAPDPRKTGSLYGLQDITVSPVTDGQWWTQNIRVTGRHIVVSINGSVVVDYTEPENPQGGTRLTGGTFALQCHDPGGTVYYRRVRVRIPRTGDAVLPDGKSAAGEPSVGDALRIYDEGASCALLRRIENGLSAFDGEARSELEETLISVAGDASASPDGRRLACRWLRQVGSERCVEPLADLLMDENLSHLARAALERSDLPAAVVSLRQALALARGEQLVGIVQSLGTLRDEASVPRLIPMLTSDRPELAAAAAFALGSIANPDAVQALQAACKRVDDPRRPVFLDGLLRAAEMMEKEGRITTAAAVYRELFATGQPLLSRCAGLQGLVSCVPEETVAILVEAMDSGAPELQALAARHVKDTFGEGVTAAFTSHLNDLQTGAQVALINALADRGDAAACRSLLDLLRAPSEEVRLATIMAVGRLGGGTEVLPLALRADQASRSERECIESALAALRGESVGDRLRECLAMALPLPSRIVLVNALAVREGSRSADDLLALLRDAQEPVRIAVLKVLPDAVGLSCLPPVIAYLREPIGNSERSQVVDTLVRVCGTDANRSPAILAIASAAGVASGEPRTALLLVLGRVGGELSLDVLQRAREEAPCDEAVLRAFFEWPDARGIPVLLEIAAGTDNSLNRILALRAVLRILDKDQSQANAARLDAYCRVLELSVRTDEVRAALAGLARLPLADAILPIEACLAQAEVRTEAALALAQLAKLLVGVDPPLAHDAANRARQACSEAVVLNAADDALAAVDALVDYLLSWKISGPYTEKGRDAKGIFDLAFAPEKPSRTGEVEWRNMPAMTEPAKPWLLDLGKAVGGNDRAAYLKTWVDCPAELDARLEVGSDDAVKVWVNGVLVHSNLVFRGVKPGEDVISIHLYAGWNSIMAKVVQGSGDWGLSARLLAADGTRITGMRMLPAVPLEEQERRVQSPPARQVLSWDLDTLIAESDTGSAEPGTPLAKGDPGTVAGVRGRAVAFDGVDDEIRARVPGLPVDPAASWSINVFVYLKEIPEPLTILAGFGDVTSGSPAGCQRYLCNFDKGIHFWGSNVDVSAGCRFDLDRWQMITVTYDGEILSIYRDGRKLVEHPESLAPAASIAVLSPLDHWNRKRRFKGSLDAFSIWQGVLTEAQMTELLKCAPASE